jgi:hypothetical protein
MNKKQKAIRLRKSVIRYLLSIGAMPEEKRTNTYKLQTPSGGLDFHIWRNSGKRGQAPYIDIMTRFDEPDTARKNDIECNPYSGKCNLHFVETDERAKMFIDRLNS